MAHSSFQIQTKTVILWYHFANMSHRCSRKLKLYLPVLEQFVIATPEERKRAITRMNKCCLDMLCECCFNAMYNPFLLSDDQKDFIYHMMGNDFDHLFCLLCNNMPKKDQYFYCSKLRNYIGIILELMLPKIKTFL